MKIKEITRFLEGIAPLNYQESYDNCGLIVGDENTQVASVLICLDSVEEVIEEAIENGCNLVIAHHPIIFSGLKKLNGKNHIERTIIKAIKALRRNTMIRKNNKSIPRLMIAKGMTLI